MEAFGHWFAAHHQLAGFTVFLISLAESLALVGLLVPGVAMMFVAGALIGTGALDFRTTCAWAIAGAIAGDGLSFWMGQHFRDRLPALWPFRSHLDLLQNGRAFFRRYGGRSIVLGRFVGPIRAVIPLVAGMMAMPPRRFLLFNVLSALLWAPAYLLPGMAFGASLDVASQVTGRLVTLLVMVLAGLWLTAWASKRLYLLLRPRAQRLILFTFELSKRHPLLGRLTAPLIDPQQRDYPGLVAWALILFAMVIVSASLIDLDLVPVSLRAIRTPWSDHALTAVAGLGQGRALLALGLGVGLWLMAARRTVALGHWAAALCFVFGLELTSRAIEPSPLAVDRITVWGTVGYGFLAVLMAEETELTRLRWLAYTSAALIATSLGFSSLYLGRATLSAVGFSWLIGLAWLTPLGMAYRRHREPGMPIRGLALVAVTMIALVPLLEARRHSVADFEHAASRHAISARQWLAEAWIGLPDRREQLFGAPSQAFDIQWAGSPTQLQAALAADGWRVAVPFSRASAFNGLLPRATPEQLPVLPHFNQGLVDRLRMIKAGPGAGWLVLRFWDSGYRLEDSGNPIWLVSCGQLKAREIFGLIRYARQRELRSEDCGRIAEAVAGVNASLHLRRPGPAERKTWLLWQPG